MANVSTLLDSKSVPSAKPALVQPSAGLTYSYGTLRDEMNRVACGLSSLGIGKGDRVCIYLESSPEYLVSYFALWRIGAIAVPASIVYRGEELLHAVSDAGASAIITDPNGARFVDQIRNSAPGLKYVLCVNGQHEGAISWDSFMNHAEGFRAVHCSLDDICHLQYTAGTTGRPKGAMLSHGNWITALDAEREALRLLPRDIYLGIYPMGHVGISWGISILRAGGTWVMMERFDMENYLAYAEHYRASVLAGMPPVIHSLVNSPAGTEMKLGNARVIISGGGQTASLRVGSIRPEISHPCRKFLRTFRNNRDRLRDDDPPGVSSSYKKLPECRGPGRVYGNQDRRFGRCLEGTRNWRNRRNCDTWAGSCTRILADA